MKLTLCLAVAVALLLLAPAWALPTFGKRHLRIWVLVHSLTVQLRRKFTIFWHTQR